MPDAPSVIPNAPSVIPNGPLCHSQRPHPSFPTPPSVIPDIFNRESMAFSQAQPHE